MLRVVLLAQAVELLSGPDFRIAVRGNGTKVNEAYDIQLSEIIWRNQVQTN